MEEHVLRGKEYHLLGIWRGDDQLASTAVTGLAISPRAIFVREANLAALAPILSA